MILIENGNWLNFNRIIFAQIWPALIEQMNIQEFCSSLAKFINKVTLSPELERFIMDKILNKESNDFKAWVFDVLL